MKIVKHLNLTESPTPPANHCYNLHYSEMKKAFEELSPSAFQVLVMLKVLDPNGAGINVFTIVEFKIMSRYVVDIAVQELEKKGFIKFLSEAKETDQSQLTLQRLQLTELETRFIGYLQFLAPNNGDVAIHIDDLAQTFKVPQSEINQAILRLFKTDRLSLDIVKALVRVN